MKQNQEINVNRMLILLLSKTKQMMPERYSVHFLWREYFTTVKKKKKLWYLLRTNVLLILSKRIWREYVNLVSCCAPAPSFRKIDLCRFAEARKQGMPLTHEVWEKKEKVAETRGISGGSEAGCSISPCLKTSAKLFLGLDPCAWPGTMGAS